LHHDDGRSTTMSDKATLGEIKRHNVVADQVAYSVPVAYPGESAQTVMFVSSLHGGPIVMQTPNDSRGTFVSNPGRFGDFGPEWVRRFFDE
jgi:hypothetical protein